MTRTTELASVRRTISTESFGIAVVVLVVAAAGVTAVSGQLAAALCGLGWPSWHGVGVNLWGPIIGVFAHGGDPMRGWPGLGNGERPGPVSYWLVFGVLMVVLLAVGVTVVRSVSGGRGRPGFASRGDVARRMGKRAALKQVPRLRPELARTTPRPTVDRIAVYRGRDVNTGVECYSTVRQSTYVVGPSESGKTSCVVIPEALDHDGPALIPSSRADVMAATWRSRADRGQVWAFDPLRSAPALPLLRWDPVRDCVDPTVAIRRARSLMSSVDMSSVEDGNAWKARGETVLRNLLHAAAIQGEDIRTVVRWVFEPTDRAPINALRRSATTPANWAEQQLRAAEAPDKQRAGIYMAVENAAGMFSHPEVLATCLPRGGEGHFDVQAFLDGSSSTVYMLTQKSDSVSAADLLAALMDEIVTGARARGQRMENNRLDPALRLIADEANNTTTWGGLSALVSDGGGRGIPVTVVVQERADGAARWGRDTERGMWGSATVRIVLPGVSGGEELREIALYADEFDEQTRSHSRGASGHSEQTGWRTRPGLTPAMVRGLPPDHALVLAAGGLRPVMTKLVPYYRRHDAAQTAAAEKQFFKALDEGRTVL